MKQKHCPMTSLIILLLSLGFFGVVHAQQSPNQQLRGFMNSLGLDAGSDDPLHPDEAFVFSAGEATNESIQLNWQIADEHYLYKNKFKFELSEASNLSIGTPELPAGEIKEDQFFGTLEVYHGDQTIHLPLSRSGYEAASGTLKVRYQGCAERGICYPPITKKISINIPGLYTPPVDYEQLAAKNRQELDHPIDVAHVLFETNAIEIKYFIEKAKKECGEVYKCVDHIWSYADVTEDEKLGGAEIARLIRHIIKFSSMTDKIIKQDKLYLVAGSMVTASAVSAIILNNYDYSGDNKLTKQEVTQDLTKNLNISHETEGGNKFMKIHKGLSGTGSDEMRLQKLLQIFDSFQ